MTTTRLRTLLDPRGTIGRGRYALLGTTLALVKVNLDRAVAGVHGEYWSPVDYWSPTGLALTEVPAGDRTFLLALVAIAIPFAWAGVALTLRRLRDAGGPAWLVVLFFVPFVNLVLFLGLSLAPGDRERRSDGGRLGRLVARDRAGSAAQAVLVSAVLTFVLLVLGTEALGSYGWGLFVGIPFTMGLVAALLHGYHEPRSLPASVGVALASVGIAGLLLLGLAVEGAICLVMAAPLVAALAAAGGVVGYALQRRPDAPAGALCSVTLLVLPLALGLEAGTQPRPAVLPVTTSVVVGAPPPVVWRHVVSFSRLPAPREAVFRAGIAYPTEARIEGRGVGAVRRCRFSTGDFVEPITVWDAPRRLAFDVRSQPPPLRELSPWRAVRPPHLDGFLRSRRGEFRLTPLPGGRTLLVGTTWYENRMRPARYWRAWSDALIHRIHRRVLEHVAASAESGARAGGLTNSLRRSEGNPFRRGIASRPMIAVAYDLRRTNGYIVADKRGRIVGRVESPMYGTAPDVPDALAVRGGFLSRRRRLVPADAIAQIDGVSGVIGLRVERELLRRFL